GNTYHKGDIVTGSDNKRYSAKKDNPAGDPVGSPDWEAAQDPRNGATDQSDSQASDSSGMGYKSILSGVSHGSNDPAGMHIHDVVAGGNGQPGVNPQINQGAGQVPSASGTLKNDSNLPEGTVAAINGTVVAGHSIHVHANENLAFDGIAGTASGGIASLS